MKKFFLVLLFCVFPFQVLAGDVSYWADGQIKRKGVSGKVVAIGMAWNGSGCLVKKAPNREEGAHERSHFATCVQISDLQVRLDFLLLQFFPDHDQNLLPYMKRTDCNFILGSI